MDVLETIFIHTKFLCYRRMENEDFAILATKIKELFPLECEKTFYVPPVLKKNSKTVNPNDQKEN